jgi:hypothetical protein
VVEAPLPQGDAIPSYESIVLLTYRFVFSITNLLAGKARQGKGDFIKPSNKEII